MFRERVLRVDHTGAAARRMRNAGGKWLANITNDDNKIAAFALTPSEAKAEIANLVRGIRDRRRAANSPFAPVVYVGKNCCSRASFCFGAKTGARGDWRSWICPIFSIALRIRLVGAVDLAARCTSHYAQTW